MDHLRLMTDDDLDDVLCWRNSPCVRRYMYTQHEISVAEHRRWWMAQQGRDDRMHLVFCDDEKALGVVSFSGIDRQNGRADWAFYAATGAPKGTGRRMETCALDHTFGHLGLRKLGCEVLASNRRVIALHKSFGFRIEGLFRQHVILETGAADVVRLAMFADRWHTLKAAITGRTKLT